MPRGFRFNWQKTLTYALLLLWSFIALFPFYWMATTSFKRPLDVDRGPRFIPFVDFDPVTTHWEYLLVTAGDDTFRHLRNSAISATGGAVLALICGTMAGYGLSRFEYYWAGLRWRNNDIAYWIISQRFLPPAVLVIPFLIMYNTLGLIDTHLGLILAYAMFNIPFTVWIMRDFFDNLPTELEDSARVDGATRWGAFMRIVLPISTPGLVATFLFSFVFVWNEYLFAMMLEFNNAITMPVLIAGQNNSRGPQWWYISALALLAVAPVTIITFLLERYITKGLLIGAVKG